MMVNLNLDQERLNKPLELFKSWLFEEGKFKNCDSFIECIRSYPEYVGWFFELPKFNPDTAYLHSGDDNMIKDDYGALAYSIQYDDIDVFRGALYLMFDLTQDQKDIIEEKLQMIHKICIRLDELDWKSERSNYFDKTR